ncbi:MAG: DUF2931 family protein [Sphingobacteriales bacterium]|nr:MAG: DUF2931 family protein [Sphingobacteriales bacterium]
MRFQCKFHRLIVAWNFFKFTFLQIQSIKRLTIYSLYTLSIFKLLIGIAPGGVVSVWLEGYRKKEIFFGQAEKINLDPGRGFNLPFDSKAESDAYIEKQLVNVLNPEELELLKKHGVPFGLWARYRNLYKWVPTYKDGKAPQKDIPVDYLNGELNWISPVLSEEIANTPRPLPRHLEFRAPTGDGSNFYVINFDEFELMSAFEKLGTSEEKIYVEFDPRDPVQLMKIKAAGRKNFIRSVVVQVTILRLPYFMTPVN